LHNPFHDALVQAPCRHQLGPFLVHFSQQFFPRLVDEGDRRQIYAYGIDPLSAGSGAPPVELQLFLPRPCKLTFKLEGHHTGFNSRVNFQHTEILKPPSFRSSAGNPTAVAIEASPSTSPQSESCPDSIQRLLVRYMEHD